jgi:hypothetical protein
LTTTPLPKWGQLNLIPLLLTHEISDLPSPATGSSETNWPLRQKPSSMRLVHLDDEPDRLTREVQHVIDEALQLIDE